MPANLFSRWMPRKASLSQSQDSSSLPLRHEADLKRDLEKILQRFSQIDARGNSGGAIEIKRAALLKQCHDAYRSYRQYGGPEHKILEGLFKQKDIMSAMDPLADNRNGKALEAGVMTVVDVAAKLKSTSSRPKNI